MCCGHFFALLHGVLFPFILHIRPLVSVTRKEMMARLVVLMGGRAAEERIFGKDNVTSGASNDLQQGRNDEPRIS